MQSSVPDYKKLSMVLASKMSELRMRNDNGAFIDAPPVYLALRTFL